MGDWGRGDGEVTDGCGRAWVCARRWDGDDEGVCPSEHCDGPTVAVERGDDALDESGEEWNGEDGMCGVSCDGDTCG